MPSATADDFYRNSRHRPQWARQCPKQNAFLTDFAECIAPAKRYAVISIVPERRNFQTACVIAWETTKTNEIAHIVTGNHFCKPPTADKILLVAMLLMNRVYKQHAFEHSRTDIFALNMKSKHCKCKT